MKLSQILNEETPNWLTPDWLDHVKTMQYPDYDHWAAYKFNISGPIDLLYFGKNSDAIFQRGSIAYWGKNPNSKQIADDEKTGAIRSPIDIIKLKNIVIMPDFDALPAGHPMLPLDTSENPLDNTRDEFGKDEEVIPYKIYGQFLTSDAYQPFYGEFEHVEGADNYIDVSYSDLDSSHFAPTTGDNIIHKIVTPILFRHYETYR